MNELALSILEISAGTLSILFGIIGIILSYFASIALPTKAFRKKIIIISIVLVILLSYNIMVTIILFLSYFNLSLLNISFYLFVILLSLFFPTSILLVIIFLKK